jgi:pyroglutamyl-peptidase
MMKVLLFGFGPFLNYETNPTETLVKELDKTTIAGAKIKGVVLPVEHGRAGTLVMHLIAKEKPDAVLAMGLFASKGSIILERIALNRFYFRTKKGKNTEEIDDPITKDGPLAYSSTLPLRSIKKRLERHWTPVEYSFSADTYVSNEVFYCVMKSANKVGINTAGFIHYPLTHYMVAQQMNSLHPLVKASLPSMQYSTIRSATKIIIAEIVKRVKSKQK